MCDNQSAIKLVRNPEFHQRTKHIDVRYHYIRQQQEQNVLTMTYVKPELQLADILTKALPMPRFATLREQLNIN